MTREGPEERSDDGPSNKASDEQREGRDERSEERPSETRMGRARGATNEERSEPRSTRERSDPEEGEGNDDVPLNIVGHEDRERPVNDAEPSDDLTADEGDGTDDEVEPVEMLVQLADDGEIDPWDIDVVQVTDAFLQVIDAQDLRTSGRALFYASVLIRMKSDAMLASDGDEPAPPEPWEQAMTEDAPIDGPDPFAPLEAEMDRRLERRRARGMPQTLDELVRDLRDAERDSWWKESRTYDTSDSPHGFQRGTQELDYRSADDLRMDNEPTENDVTATTHAENMDDIIDAVYAVVREQYDAGREEVLYREVQLAGGSRVETFLGLLFLSHRGQVLLQQDELFGDLWVQDPTVTTGANAGIAD